VVKCYDDCSFGSWVVVRGSLDSWQINGWAAKARASARGVGAGAHARPRSRSPLVPVIHHLCERSCACRSVYLTHLFAQQDQTDGKVNLSAASLAKIHDDSHVGHDRELLRNVTGIGA
jgi:hypothetical protein